jgi:hypothetical protein
MIGYYEVIALLGAACPTFADSRAREDRTLDDGEFVEIGRLAVHLIDLLERGQTASFEAVFEELERVLLHGDADARSLIGAGLLDDLTNAEFYAGTATPADMVPWMGPEARRHPSVRALPQ